jgi:hypothetical protein
VGGIGRVRGREGRGGRVGGMGGGECMGGEVGGVWEGTRGVGGWAAAYPG